MPKLFLALLLLAATTVAQAQKCQLLKAVSYTEDGDTSSVLEFKYDKDGKLESWTEEYGFGKVLYRAYYGTDGRLMEWTDMDANADTNSDGMMDYEVAVYRRSLDYDAKGNVTKVYYFDDLNFLKEVAEYTYDANGNLKTYKGYLLEGWSGEDTIVIGHNDYSYNPAKRTNELIITGEYGDKTKEKSVYDDKIDPYNYIGFPLSFWKNNVVSYEYYEGEKIREDLTTKSEYTYNKYDLPVKRVEKVTQGDYINSITDYIYNCK